LLLRYSSWWSKATSTTLLIPHVVIIIVYHVHRGKHWIILHLRLGLKKLLLLKISLHRHLRSELGLRCSSILKGIQASSHLLLLLLLHTSRVHHRLGIESHGLLLLLLLLGAQSIKGCIFIVRLTIWGILVVHWI